MQKYSDRLSAQGKYEFSFEPKSLWNYKRNSVLEKICDTNYKKDQLEKVKEDWVKAGTGGYLSGWNKEYQKRIVEMWSTPGSTILDPFAGHSSAFIPWLMHRNFIGFEITKNRWEIQTKHMELLQAKFSRTNSAIIHNTSSEYMDEYIEDESVDCIVTDPPFWNLEKYEKPVKGTQLSDLNKKDDFNKMFTLILKKSIAKLKFGGFAIVKIANFRNYGQYLNLRDEWIHIIEGLGVRLHDEVILELSPVKRHPLYSQAITNLNCLKVQEFLLVFRKDGTAESNINFSNEINHNRPLVSSIYPDEERLFWAESRNKIDWITAALEQEYNSSDKEDTTQSDILF